MSIEPINPNAILIRTSKGNILITHEIESILEIKIYSSCIKKYIQVANEINNPAIITLTTWTKIISPCSLLHFTKKT